MFQHKTKLSISIDTKSNIYDYTRTLKFRDIGLQFSKYGLPLLLDSTDIIGNYSIMTKREFWSWNNFHNRQVGNLAYSKSREIPAVLSNIRIEKEGEDVRYRLLGDIGYDRKKESRFILGPILLKWRFVSFLAPTGAHRRELKKASVWRAFKWRRRSHGL